jgi:tetratricopeptide (TPR) repeat protein
MHKFYIAEIWQSITRVNSAGCAMKWNRRRKCRSFHRAGHARFAMECQGPPVRSPAMTSPPTPLEMAVALLREGRPIDAQELMVRELQKVEREHGRGSPAWASAQCDLGHVLLNSDQFDRAAECYRQACSGPVPANPEDRKDQITYRLNLGMALHHAGRLDEAVTELRRNVQERADFYGREHSGHAFGLEALADVLYRRGDLQEAREAAEETVATFWRDGHERVAGALALRAEILKAAGTEGPAFGGLESLPDGIVERMAVDALNRVDRADPRTAADVLADLASLLEARLGPDHQATLNVLSALANLGHHLGDQGMRIDTIRRVLASYDRQGRHEQALMTVLGLAMAYGDAGDPEEGLRAYAEARQRAERIDHPELTSQVLRNWGLALKEAGRKPEAEQRLREAVDQALRGADHEMVGRARIALGLFLQHEERLEEARSIVSDALAGMDPAHPDAVVGRSHLGAIEEGRSCGCGDMGGAIAEAFRRFVLHQLPEGLLSRFDVAVEDGDFKIQVELSREPEQEELERLDRVIQAGYADFRRRLTTRV